MGWYLINIRKVFDKDVAVYADSLEEGIEIVKSKDEDRKIPFYSDECFPTQYTESKDYPSGQVPVDDLGYYLYIDEEGEIENLG